MRRPDSLVVTWRKYRWNEGMLAFILSRVSAVLVAGYLVAHVLVTSLLGRGPTPFNAAMRFVDRPIFKLLEIGLVGIIIAHAVQGSRVVALNLGLRSQTRKALLAILGAVGIVLFLLAAWTMFPFRGGNL
jgi:succinate dehydrogenase / fumarate reductase cytochrome b subunit